MQKTQDAYEVGYCKPPKSGQFEKGKSGNQKGRPKGSKSTAFIVKKVLDQKIGVRENGSTKRISLEEACYKKLADNALKGKTLDVIRFLNEISKVLPERHKEEIEEHIITVQYVLPDGKTMSDYDYPKCN